MIWECNIDNYIHSQLKEHQAVTGGIFYCRVSAEMKSCGSLETLYRFDSDVLRNRQQKHTANPLSFITKSNQLTKDRKMTNNNESILINNIERFYREVVIHQKHTIDKLNSQNSVSIKNTEYATLFADFGGSTELVDNYDLEFSTWLLKSYLTCVSFFIHQNGGEIIAFEGDGLMGIFSGSDKESNAVQCSFNIQWAVTNIIQPKIDFYFPEFKYNMHQVVGIDSSELTPLKTEIWEHYDLLWIGRSSNYSANLTRINNHNYSTYITENVYSNLPKELQRDGGDLIWEQLHENVLNIKVYRTNRIEYKPTT